MLMIQDVWIINFRCSPAFSELELLFGERYKDKLFTAICLLPITSATLNVLTPTNMKYSLMIFCIFLPLRSSLAVPALFSPCRSILLMSNAGKTNEGPTWWPEGYLLYMDNMLTYNIYKAEWYLFNFASPGGRVEIKNVTFTALQLVYPKLSAVCPWN